MKEVRIERVCGEGLIDKEEEEEERNKIDWRRTEWTGKLNFRKI